MMLTEIGRWGYGVSEELLQALHATSPAFKQEIVDVIREIMGAGKKLDSFGERVERTYKRVLHRPHHHFFCECVQRAWHDFALWTYHS